MNDFNPKTVTIGNQVWMAENLSIDDGGEGIYHNRYTDAYHYTWDAAMRVANSIPGWHLPTAREWNEAALACGAAENPSKYGPDYNDCVGAQALKDKLGIKLVGRGNTRCFCDVGSGVRFWAATECSSTDALYRSFGTDALMESASIDKTYGAYSVRLVKEV